MVAELLPGEAEVEDHPLALVVQPVELRIGLEVPLERPGRVAIVVDAAVGVQPDAGEELGAALLGDLAEALSRLEPAVAVPEQSPDDHALDAVLPAPAEQVGVVGDE